MKTYFQKSAQFLSVALMATSLLTHSAVAADETKFKDMKVAPGLAQANSLIGTLLPFLTSHPETSEGPGSIDLSVRKADGGYVVNIINDGYLDDSVRGEHFRGFVIFNSKGTWELISMSVKPLCSRGQSANGGCL